MSLGSERVADRELKALQVVAPVSIGLALVSDRDRVAETEQTERRQPLHADAHRSAQLAQVEVVFLALAELVLEFGVAEVERIAEVEEQAGPCALRELLGHGQQHLELPGDSGVAAIGILERI